MSSDEIFICGSSAEIQEITHVDNQEIVRNTLTLSLLNYTKSIYLFVQIRLITII